MLVQQIIFYELFILVRSVELRLPLFQVYALTRERDTLRREQNKKTDAAVLLKEKDEIINQVMAEGVISFWSITIILVHFNQSGI